MAASPRFQSHDEYFASATPKVRPILRQIQTVVEERVPAAARVIGYNMPAFKAGRIFFYFAAFKQHIGVYPPVKADTKLIQRLAPYRGPKGNLSFPLDEPMPYELIGRVAASLAKEYSKK